MNKLTIASLALVAVAAACGGSRSPAAEPAPSAAADTGASASAVAVEIDNRNVNTMSIYLLNAGVPLLIGTAPGLSKTRLWLPQGSGRATGQVRLLAEPSGASGSIRTPTLIVAPGQRVYWSIGTDAASSSASAG